MVRKLIFPPVQTFVRAEEQEIGGSLVVNHNQDRARVSEFPHVSVLVDFFPGKARITAEESIGIFVRC